MRRAFVLLLGYPLLVRLNDAPGEADVFDRRYHVGLQVGPRHVATTGEEILSYLPAILEEPQDWLVYAVANGVTPEIFSKLSGCRISVLRAGHRAVEHLVKEVREAVVRYASVSEDRSNVDVSRHLGKDG
jgi:hypothetical protein